MKRAQIFTVRALQFLAFGHHLLSVLCVSAWLRSVGPVRETRDAMTSRSTQAVLWEQWVQYRGDSLAHCPTLSFFATSNLHPLSPPLFSPCLPPYEFHSSSFLSSHSHPHSLYTWGSCSFIANWTFHSERNNYSLERKGDCRGMLIWHTMSPCHSGAACTASSEREREERMGGTGGGSASGKGEEGIRRKVAEE